MGKNIFHAGGPGAGQAVKICNNMMLAINMVGVSEGFPAGPETRPGLGQTARDLLHRDVQLLGSVELLSGPRTGAGGAVQPGLRARVHDAADGQGRETVAGGGRGDGFAHTARGAWR